MATKWLQKLQRRLIRAEILGICGRIAYYQCGFSREIKVVKSSGSDTIWLTKCPGTVVYQQFPGSLYYSVLQFATLLQHDHRINHFAADEVIPIGFEVKQF